MWTLGGLSLRELLRRTWLAAWSDEVYGQAGRMAFYHFLAVFPCLLIFLAFTRDVPIVGVGMKNSAISLIHEVLPPDAAGLMDQMAAELQQHILGGFKLLVTAAGALWAAMNGTWALIFGLNVAYEVKEDRSTWKLGLTMTGLILALATAGCFALLLLFAVTSLLGYIFQDVSKMSTLFDWLTLFCLLVVCFAITFRFAPNLKNAQWKWSTPGSLCALTLWFASTLGLRFYFGHITNYQRTFGHLNTVAMLLLWLYLANACVLIGGEMNSEIQKAAGEATHESAMGSRTRRAQSPPFS